MEDKAKCGHSLYWHNCYSGTYDLIHPDSIAHPAKMSPALCFRILQHLQELGLLKESDTVLDPMSGTGITNICAGAMGYQSVSVELEEKFIEFEKQNKEYAERRLYKPLDWQMIQGDSRKLSELLQGQGLKSVTSPPYEDSQGHPSLGSVNKDDWGKEGKDIVKRRGLSGEYGESEGQVGNLKSITSPPYGETGVGDWKTGRAEFQEWVINEIKTKGYVEWQGKRYTEAEWRAMNHGRIDGRTTKGVHKHPTDGYSDNPDNIGGLSDKPLKSILSPPYGNPRNTTEEYDDKYDLRRPKGVKWGRESFRGRYGATEGQIGDLEHKPLKSVMSSPYGDTEKRDRSIEASGEKEKDYPRGDHNISTGYQGSPDNIGWLDDKPLKSVMSPPYDGHKGHGGNDLTGIMTDKGLLPIYGHANGQIGDTHSESYLEAMAKVYSEIALVSDVLCVVVKNPTRGGKLRRLDLDTIRILELSGWKIHCQHRALLFEELEQLDLFEGMKKRVKGRLSFFKRLSWQNGQPVASWEDIIVCTRE